MKNLIFSHNELGLVFGQTSVFNDAERFAVFASALVDLVF